MIKLQHNSSVNFQGKIYLLESFPVLSSGSVFPHLKSTSIIYLRPLYPLEPALTVPLPTEGKQIFLNKTFIF